MFYPVIIRHQGRIRQLKSYHIILSSKEGEVGLFWSGARLAAKMINFSCVTKPSRKADSSKDARTLWSCPMNK